MFYVLEVWEGDAIAIPCETEADAGRVRSLILKSLEFFSGYIARDEPCFDEADYDNCVLEADPVFATDWISGEVVVCIFEADRNGRDPWNCGGNSLADFARSFAGEVKFYNVPVEGLTVARYNELATAIVALSEFAYPEETAGDFVGSLTSA